MKFYNRTKELALLHGNSKQTDNGARMTFVVGRRRVGKTSLLRYAFKDMDSVYLFVARKNEVLLCEDFVPIIENALKIRIPGHFNRFAELFDYLMTLSRERHFTLVVDEFQEFFSINPSVYSELQGIWDIHKGQSKMHVVFCGSMYSLMKRIFEDAKEPLFGRANSRLHVRPFTPSSLHEIMADHVKKVNAKDLLALYTITGGIPKYVEALMDAKAFTLPKMANHIFTENSFWVDEGKNLLIEEFGRDYSTYFSILSLIVSSKNARPEIESILDKNVGGYMDRLEHEYSVIASHKPIFAKSSSRIMKYEVVDPFLAFWFRFYFKYRSSIELGNFDYVRDIFLRDFSTYAGKMLEKWFIESFKEQNAYTNLGSHWDKKGNEIDIIGIDDRSKRADIMEVKLDKSRHRDQKLLLKSQSILHHFEGYEISYKSLSMEDMLMH